LFNDIFFFLKSRVPEISYIGIWDRDGLEVERVHYDRHNFNTELLGAECADIVTRLSRASGGKAPGLLEARWQENVITATALKGSFFLLAMTTSPAIAAKTRFYLQSASHKINSLLSH